MQIYPLRLHTDTSDTGSTLLFSLTSSLVVFSIVTFLTGLLLGCVFLRYTTKPKISDMDAPAPPVYEEITPAAVLSQHAIQDYVKVVNNEAYGSMLWQLN